MQTSLMLALILYSFPLNVTSLNDGSIFDQSRERESTFIECMYGGREREGKYINMIKINNSHYHQ